MADTHDERTAPSFSLRVGSVELLGEQFSIVKAGDSDTVRAAGFGSPSSLAYSVFGRQSELLDVRALGDTDPALAAVRAYDDGDPALLETIDIHQDGTELRRAMWRAARLVEPGTLASYGDVAAIAGHPRAARAAASACGACLVGLFVPVHRIVRASGKLAGHAADIAVRQALIDHERAMGMGR
ncbi:methylated-DNA-[protein]-cysteine S-methyltransferase [Pseudoclavibacter sp. JAI123]|uniref:methylated-DNA--[protein]-cysteine S-methyltransferase n=1 Tax=Pseudoclavibacter sp. JAI123 TaxID=2723065 RepID=UPI0015CA9264|nr:methylated-DNA--[protein]-cysteine S-methyltransferase [Pseudoclavibacter sp. JAI123]NYF12215.1 methylated-DNA-[protein]-cysteine S-methyltransferase [Pseudoclavibacter sp. JAI123]